MAIRYDLKKSFLNLSFFKKSNLGKIFIVQIKF